MEQPPKEYLRKKIEQPNSKPAGEVFSRNLEKPFAEKTYGEDGPFTFELPRGRIAVKYEKVPDAFLFKKVEEQRNRGRETREIIEAMGFEPEKFKTLVELELQTDRNKLSLKETLPEGCTVYFATEPLAEGSKTGYLEKLKVIVVNKNITTPESIIALFHEVGHAIDETNKTDSEKKLHYEARKRFKSAGQPIHSPTDAEIYKVTEKDLALVLESERKAWAFALKKLKPFFELLNITGEEVRDYIHKAALASYSKTIRQKIEAGLVV